MNDIERLLDAAAGGDVEALIELGKKMIDAGAVEDALRFFTQAAEDGSVIGAFYAMVVHEKISGGAKKCFDWDSVLKHTKDTIALYTMVSESHNLPESILSDTRDKYLRSVYQQAVAKYFSNEEMEAMQILDELDWDDFPTPFAFILRGNCSMAFGVELYKEGDNDYKGSFNVACNLYAPLEQHAEAVVNAAEDAADLLILTQAFLYYALVLREERNDLQHAYDVLRKGYEALPDEDFKKMISQELSHYRTSFFGGLKYV